MAAVQVTGCRPNSTGAAARLPCQRTALAASCSGRPLAPVLLGALGSSGTRTSRSLRRRGQLRDRKVVQASQQGGPRGEKEGQEAMRQDNKESMKIFAIGLGLALAVSAGAVIFADEIEDIVYYGALDDVLVAGFGPGDLFGAALWSLALYFTSPLQLLLLFLGRFDAERPSDWFMQKAGRAAGLPVDEVDYAAPAWLRASAVAAAVASGAAIALTSAAALGDATWAVSTGIGACFAAGIYELGRPTRLSRDEAVALEATWQDFATFAGQQLQRSGRCHESEVLRSFQQKYPRYRLPGALPDETTIRDLIRNYAPEAERSPQGFYKRLSLRPAGALAVGPAKEAAAELGTGAVGQDGVASP